MKSKNILGVAFVCILLLAMFSLLQPRQSITAKADLKIDPNLINRMDAGGGPYDAMVKVVWNPDLESIKFNHDAVVSELKAEAARTQEPVITYLRQKREAQVLNTFWVDNLILVKADEGTIRELASLSTVERVDMNFRITLPEGDTMTLVNGTVTPATWNIERVRAPEVWQQFGITGEGISFATEDTGVDITHQDLVDTLFTADPSDPGYPGGWSEFDASGNPVWSTPHDTWTHGTATYGLIVGDANGPYGAIGMAPGAKGLGKHALTLPGGGGTFAQVIAGLQWILDPYDKYGNHYAMPRVSSHSWGAVGYFSELIAPVRNLYFAGQLVVASIGNTPQGQSGSPGNIYETFGVGATDMNDHYVDPSHGWASSGEIVYKSDFPSAPADWPDSWVKPDISAPGDNVIVPQPGNSYVYWGGTSFSAPHVSGAAVLMLSGNPSLNPDELKTALEQTAVFHTDYNPSPPDTYYGWGRIDAFEAVAMVALPQGIVGTVTDASTTLPVAGVKVQVGTRATVTDASGHYDVRLQPGTYSITFSKFGYESQTINNIVVAANQFTTLNIALTLVPPGFVAGYVRFGPTAVGIPGATVEALDIPAEVKTETDIDGHYTLALPPGTYSFKASAYGFKSVTSMPVGVTQGVTTPLDFDLSQPPTTALIGDYQGKIAAFLTGKGLAVESYDSISSIIPDIAKYNTIIVNYPTSSPSYTDMANFISATDANGVGVLWLDSWMSGSGGYYLWYYSYYYGLPIGFSFYRFTTYYYGYPPDVYNYMRTTETDSDILDAWPVGYVIPHDIRGVWHDSAYYYMFDPETSTRHYLASFGMYEYGYFDDYGYTTIAKIDRGTNRWMMLSLHGNDVYTDVSGWSDDSIAVFMNSLNWAAKPSVAHPKFVVWDLTATPQVGLWSDPRTISVGVKNLWIPGTTTIKVYVDSILESSTDVTLGQGESTYLSKTVSRFLVGTYTVTVKQLKTTFVVRAPRINVQAYEVNSNTPLAGADIYGYYRKYRGTGWALQDSIAYGGYGHSQMAQPVGDLDGDGKNEVIVGGYETIGNGRTRILRYNDVTGSYDNIFDWTEGGGSYNSPSGAAIADIDLDGRNELVVSWSYSGPNDGVWVYRFDGTNLYKLAHYYASFIFDVLVGDYDGDATPEILVSNAPWGGTPYHVFALRFDGNTNTLTFEAGYQHAGLSWEAPMLWTGDVDGDGDQEITTIISDGAYNTAGVFVLHWNKITNSWDEELAYNGPWTNFGTPYGVAVGDINHNLYPEILLGNNINGYVGAAAIILEYNGITFDKVFQGSWPSEYAVIEAVAVDDADNDGANEAAIGGGYVHLIGWTGTSYEEEATLTQTQGMLAGTIIGDTDTDGKNEIKACDIVGLGPGMEWFFKYFSEPTPEPEFFFKKFGTTDAMGRLSFDSPESVVDMYLFAYKEPKTSRGYQYLLTKYNQVIQDTSVTYKPTSKTEAFIVAKPNSKGLYQLQHTGIVWLQENEIPILWPFTAFMATPTNIVVTPETYTFRHMLNEIDQFGSWWYYFMAPDQMASLTGGQTYSYSFAGPIQGTITHTQTDSSVKIDWNVFDSYGHQITGITQEDVTWLASGTTSYSPVPVTPSKLNDVITQVGQSIDYYPLIVLYDTSRITIKSGYVHWYEKPAYTTSPRKVYYAELDFVSGPYGNPNTKMAITVIVEPHSGGAGEVGHLN